MKRHDIRNIIGKLTLAGAIALLPACATGHLPEMPTAAAYEQSCASLFSQYQQTDKRANDRKLAVASVDMGIAATAVSVAVGGATGVGVPLGAIFLSRAKGDLGHGQLMSERSTLHQMAIRKGCTNEDLIVLKRQKDQSNADELELASVQK